MKRAGDLAVQHLMVRLRTKVACTVLLGAGLALVALQSDAQTTAPSQQPLAPGQPLHWSAQPPNGQGVTPPPQQVPMPMQPGIATSGQPATPAPATAYGSAQPGTGASTQPAPPHRTSPYDSPQPTTATPGTASPRPAPSMATTPATNASRKNLRGKKAAVAEVPATPPPPPTLEQTPPTAPQVNFNNGQLTIDAANSTLAQVLHAVQSQTGASIEMPSSANSERVVTQIGPGQPSDVLRTLLNGSKFDYVILGVNGNPGAVQKVILTPRTAGGVATAQNNTPHPQGSQDESEDSVAENEETPEQPPVTPTGLRRPVMPGQPPNQPPETPAYAGPGGESQAGKTPEQLMQELQQMQQQQQQYQDQLNPANRPQ